MRADDLQQAVSRIARILETADLRAAVDRFRASRGDERTAAAARLGHAGALISERLQQVGPLERSVLASLNLAELSQPAYWQQLLEAAGPSGAGSGDIVRLAARLMFVSVNLPGLVDLLAAGDDPVALGEGEASLATRLIDAGEQASDPDRIARSIDGIDMLYSACASIARRPAIALRLERIDGHQTRDMHFVGGRDAVKAVAAVIESIPDALADIDENADLDLDAIVGSLPVFDDLRTLASLGSFSESDLRDIGETMHQGALLVLESGVVLAPVERTEARSARAAAASPASSSERSPNLKPTLPSGGNGLDRAASGDRHYDEYLRERAAMQQAGSDGATPAGIKDTARAAVGSTPSAIAKPASSANGGRPAEPARSAFSSADLKAAGADDDGEADRQRRDAVEELLQSLAKARGKGS